MADTLQQLALIVEFLGLGLIALELYAPQAANRLRTFLDRRAGPARSDEASAPSRNRRVWQIVAAYVVICTGLAFWDPRWMLLFILASTAVFLLLGALQATFGLAFLGMRLGVILGRGNSIGGLGLLLAFVGFSFEVFQVYIGPTGSNV